MVDKSTHEKRSEAGKKGAAALSHEQRQEIGRKAAATRGSDEMRKMGQQGGAHSQRSGRSRKEDDEDSE